MSNTNRLIHQTSPYLLQHAHNPVDWYPWGDEALAAIGEGDDALLGTVSAKPDLPAAELPGMPVDMDAPPCPDCGSMMIRAGTCFRCGNCGGTSGCS